MDLAQRVQDVSNVAETIAHTMEELIYAAELRPGQYLRQESLDKEFGVSRVPVRDALHLLERRGLAVTIPRKGVMVRPLTPEEVRDLYGLRKALEPYAAREAASRITPNETAKLAGIIDTQRRAQAQGDMKTFMSADEDFHRELCALAGNKALNEVIADVWVRIKQVRSVARADTSWGEQWATRSVQRHERILATVSSGNGKAAVRITEEVIRQSSEELMRAMAEFGWTSDAE